MPGVCGTSLVSPGWLVLGVTVGADDVQTLKSDTTQMHIKIIYNTIVRALHLLPTHAQYRKVTTETFLSSDY